MNLRKRFLVCISVVLSMVLLTACPTIVNNEGEVIFGESISTDASSVLESETTATETTLFIPTVTPTPVPTATPVPSPTPTLAPQNILVSFIGDCTLGDALAWNGSEGGFDAVIDGDYEYCFQNAVPYLSEDDMTLANFEGTLTDATVHQEKEFVFGSPFEYVEMLTNASIEAVNLANNHSYDYFDEGLQDTKDTLDGAGIVWNDDVTVSVYEVKGIKIGMLGALFPSSASTLYGYVDQLKEEGCNIIIASCHWGVEKDYEPRASEVQIGHDLIDYGVDIVIGTHPHRLQPIEYYNGKYIVYSISNFCFGGNTGLSDPDTCILQCNFQMDSTNSYVESYELNVIPFSQTSSGHVNDYCPVPYEWGSEDYYRVMERLDWSQEDE